MELVRFIYKICYEDQFMHDSKFSFVSTLGMSRFLEMYMSNHSSINTNSNASVNTESSSLLGTNSVFFAKNGLPVTWSVIFTLCFLEAIGLYSLIVALFLSKV